MQTTEKARKAQPTSGKIIELFPDVKPAQQHTVSFTIVESEAVLTKTFGIDSSGQIVQTAAAGVPSKATAKRITLTGDSAAIAKKFAAVLGGLTVNQVLVLAPPPAGADSYALVPRRELERAPGAIAKTAENFRAPEGPALFGLDLDLKTYPDFIRERIAERGNLKDALASVCVGLGTATYVVRNSSSAGVKNKATGRSTGTESGRHRYYFVKDGRDAAGLNGFAARLRDRLVLAGFGFGIVSGAGVVIVKTLIDRSASQDYARFWYESNAHLTSPSLVHEPEARRPKVVNEHGGFLDASQIPALSDDERKELARIEAEIIASMQAQAEPVRAAWLADREKKLIAKGVSPERAAKIVRHALETRELVGDFELTLDDGRTVTVDDILDDPADFHEATCGDPAEPTYGGGRNKAKIFAESSATACVHSFAHGGIVYLLRRAPAHWFDKQAAAATSNNEEEVALTTDSVTAAVRRLNKRHAMVLSGGKSLVIDESADGVSFTTVEKLRAWYANDTIILAKKDASVFDVWLQSRQRRQYEDVVFAPEGAAPNKFNLWRGFAVQPDPKASCDRFLAHLRDNVAAGNDDHFRWIVGFFAQMVQQPGEKPGVALVLRGGQGTGKSIVGRYVGGLFPAHHVVVSQPDHLTGKFNAHLERAVLVQAEEAFWAGDRAAAGGALKDLITSDRMRIERKGVDAIEVRNNVRVLVTTNSRWAVPAGSDERRFAVFDVADHHKQDGRYFGAIEKEMRSGGLAALLHYLQSIDLSSIDLRSIPNTEALLDQKLESLDPLQRWWLSKLQAGKIRFSEAWPGEMDKAEAYVDYVSATEKIGRPMSDSMFGREFRKLCPGIQEIRPRRGDERVRAFVLPSLADCRSSFCELIGADPFGGSE